MTRCIWTPYSSNSNMAAVQKSSLAVVWALHPIVHTNSSKSTKFGTDVAEGILKWFSQDAWANGPSDQDGGQIQYGRRLKGIRSLLLSQMRYKYKLDVYFTFFDHRKLIGILTFYQDPPDSLNWIWPLSEKGFWLQIFNQMRYKWHVWCLFYV